MQKWKADKDAVMWTADDGGWVPANVAMVMYEVLMMIDNDYHSQLSPMAGDRMQDALAAADGEEV